MKGPCVYCLEETDNGSNLPGLFLDTSAPLREHFEQDLLGGVTVIGAQGKRLVSDEWKEGELYKECAPKMEDAALTFVPYAYWGNRVTGEMLVWVREIL